LNEDLYDAEVAGLHFNIYPTQTGITIHTTGLSAGQLPLLSYLMRQAWSVRFDRQRWQAVSEQLVNNWRSAHQHQPLNMLFSELNLALQQGLFRLSDMAAACGALSYTHFAHTVGKLFDSLHISAFIHGDWQRQHADELHALIQANTPGKSVPVKPQRQQIKRLSQAAQPACITVPTEYDDHAALCYFQGPSDSPSDQIAIMLLQQLIHQFVFDQLRTQRQLGYMAGSQYFGLQRIPGIIIFVQSPATPPAELQRHILDVTHAAVDKLNSLSLKEWSHTKSVLEQQLAVDDRSLRVRSQRLWGAIQLGDTRFDRADQLRAALANWQLDEWLSYVNRLLFEQPATLQLQTRAISR
jgi:secreted Zn-dependent insulinase-like peptidase